MNVLELLRAHWRVSMQYPKQKRLFADAQPPSLQLQAALAKTRIRVAGEGFALEGDLTELPTFCERVWWKLGWSNLRFPELAASSYVAGRLVEAGYEEAEPLLRAHLEASPQAKLLSELLDGKGVDDTDVRIAKMFGGRKRASRKVLIKNTLLAYLKDERPLQRRAALLECAEYVAGANGEWQGTSVEEIVEPALVALEDEAACVREAALVLFEWLGCFLVGQGDYAAALRHLDLGVSKGPSFAAQHARRFRARLALARDDADDDWRVFAAAVEKLADVSRDTARIRRALAFFRIGALLEAASICKLQEQGLPTNEDRRRRWEAFYEKSPWGAPKAKLPPSAERQRFADARRRFAREALERLSALVPAAERKSCDLPVGILPLEPLDSDDLRPTMARLRELAAS
jgi:hypothetical protein